MEQYKDFFGFYSIFFILIMYFINFQYPFLLIRFDKFQAIKMKKKKKKELCLHIYMSYIYFSLLESNFLPIQ